MRKKHRPCFLRQTLTQAAVEKAFNYYLRTTAGRIKLIKFLGRFAVIGGVIVATILFVAVYLKGKAS